MFEKDYWVARRGVGGVNGMTRSAKRLSEEGIASTSAILKD